MNREILQFIKQVQSISHIGLSFSEDPYALDNYKELKKLSREMLERYSHLKEEECDLYKDFIYPTPQPAVRAFVVQEGKILLVQEKDSQLWSLPGGWCDVEHTPKEAAIKETIEESGYVIECSRLLGVFDRRNYEKSALYDVYCLYFLGNVVSGTPKCNHETMDVGWFDIAELPPLSQKNSICEIKKAYEVYHNNLETYYE